ncbi:MAG: S41 family peptidase, partial [Candidatus Komeilibacteria bacterium]|nr:S41 family peptidase [Candidatus Komeilibacteria bacterium]
IKLAGYWIKSGQPVVSEQYADPNQKDVYTASGSTDLVKYPTVILVNGGSASASEIFSGALKDYGLAKLVGQKTFGKGTVQALEKLPDGSSVKLTIAKWLTPKGTSIEEQGITPDFEVAISEDDYNNAKDPQLDKAKELLLNNK